MPWHVIIKLPDGRTACADHRDPIVKTIRRARKNDPADVEEVNRWLDAHEQQSADCHAGTCAHD